MAAKKKKGKKKGGARRSAGKKKRKHPRRRRNPGSGTFMSRAGHLAGGALVALATGVLVTVATGKAAAGGNLALYGIPAGTFVAGALIAKPAPTIGTGIALGAFAPFALPVASRILTAGTPSANSAGATAKAAAGLGRSVRRMSAVQASGMGRSTGYRDMDAVAMGAVMGDVDDDYDD